MAPDRNEVPNEPIDSLEQAPEEITDVVVSRPIPFEASGDEEQKKVEAPEESPPIESSVAETSPPTEVAEVALKEDSVLQLDDSKSCATQDILPTT